jgi:LssY C-terminus
MWTTTSTTAATKKSTTRIRSSRHNCVSASAHRRVAGGFDLRELTSVPDPNHTSRSRRLRLVWFTFGLLAAYGLFAYVIAPLIWRVDMYRHPNLRTEPKVTHTGTGIPGDPLNISLVGSKPDVIRALAAAGWYPADPITFKSSVRIAVDTVFRRPDDDAPVSNLYLYGRKQDLAFEKPVDGSPKQRHHVRLWRTERMDENRDVWIGAAIYDMGVELSRTTGQVTHHIAPDIDVERDFLISDLQKAGRVKSLRWENDFHEDRSGRNGGGDPWHTDGRLAIVVLTETGPARP